MTGNADDLRDLEGIDVAYCLRIEGISTSFVSRAELADGTWLDDRAAQLECLDLPKFTMGINPRKGTFTTNTATFTLRDVDDSLADLFASVRSDRVPLENTIAAGSADVVSPTSSHVAIEYFGSNGERMQYPAIPNWGVGYRHVGKLDAFQVAETPVTAKPLVWAGRRCVLLRVFHNKPAAGSNMGGVNWTAPVNSDVIWFGTALDSGTVRGKTWSFRCAGPESWLEKNVGQNTWTQPLGIVDAELDLTASEAQIGGFLVQMQSKGNNAPYDFGGDGAGENAHYGEDQFSTSFSAGDVATIRSEFETFINNLAAAANNDGAFTSTDLKKSIFFDTVTHELRIWIEDNANDVTAAAFIFLHQKVWERLGYLPTLQGGKPVGVGETESPHLSPEDPLWVRFFSPPEFNKVYWPVQEIKAWEEGFFGAAFLTTPPGLWNGTLAKAGAAPVDGDNNGDWRVWRPIHPGGTFILPSDLTSPVEIEFGSGDFVFVEGQHDQAPASDPDDKTAAYTIGGGVGAVDSTTLVVIRGPYRLDNNFNDPENEAFIETQVARISWRSDSVQGIKHSTNGLSRVVIHEWLDPRLFGINRDKLKDNWVALANTPNIEDTLQIVPLSHFGVSDEGLDPIHLTAQRLLLGSGTGTGWPSFYDNEANTNVPGEGENEPDGDGEWNPHAIKDYEISSMGLAIPASRVSPPGDWFQEYLKIEPGVRRAKMAYVGRVSGAEVFQGLMEPLGLVPHLRNGKFGWFCPWDTISPGDATLTITSESYSAGAGRPESSIPRQAVRVFSPIDSLRLSYNFNAADGEHVGEQVYPSTDDGARYRTQNVEHAARGPGLRPSYNDLGDLYTRWKRGFDWWARRHFKIQGQKLQRKNGQRCWPGTLVRYTDPWAVNPDGTYSISNFAGFVTKVTYDCAKEEAAVDFLLQEDGGLGIHYYAPIARVYGWDSSSKILYCEDDMYSLGYGQLDVTWFAEPAWSAHGGSASVELYQYDGNTWTGGIYGTVSSVNAEASNSTITLTGALTGGTFYRDKDTVVVMRDYANQGAEWVKQLFAGTANEDGQVNGSTANSVKFNGI